MQNLKYFITKQKIPYPKPLKYLITIPCVNREERNAINVIDKTFESFEESGMFADDNNIEFTILLFESGSNDVSYLDPILKYKNVKAIYSDKPLNGVSNTFKMFFYLQNSCIFRRNI